MFKSTFIAATNWGGIFASGIGLVERLQNWRAVKSALAWERAFPDAIVGVLADMRKVTVTKDQFSVRAVIERAGDDMRIKFVVDVSPNIADASEVLYEVDGAVQFLKAAFQTAFPR